MCKQLANLGITTVADVRASRREALQRELGAKTGSLVRGWQDAPLPEMSPPSLLLMGPSIL